MEGLPNRRQRREWARQTGQLRKKSKASLKEQREMSARAAEIGKQIHLTNTERILREQEEAENKRREEKLNLLITEGKTQEEALKILSESQD